MLETKLFANNSGAARSNKYQTIIAMVDGVGHKISSDKISFMFWRNIQCEKLKSQTEAQQQARAWPSVYLEYSRAATFFQKQNRFVKLTNFLSKSSH